MFPNPSFPTKTVWALKLDTLANRTRDGINFGQQIETPPGEDLAPVSAPMRYRFGGNDESAVVGVAKRAALARKRRRGRSSWGSKSSVGE